MIILSDNEMEIGIYPGRCIEAKNLKNQNKRSLKWGEVKRSAILRNLTENLMSRLTYELNGFSAIVFGYERIDGESRPTVKTLPDHTEPEKNIMANPKLFLRSTEVEELYGISASTLANWRSKRTGPKYHKVGGAVRYKVEDLDAFMESKKVSLG